ncbi:FixH family protein [Gymnodinialimonas ceratoperidinii]|uniref:FixH family protein n=1 Tax=Gymnodinialimonas ceratoperidinii TaxID=2856823 RepID=A0A8F6YBB4_9RHOB|nr:FixH family protein [Gymnodinialimonas ceratoperidinii]QXT40388.1 FixH family protein [Gymnodinialimonas ceratoperidinii]
MTVRTDKARGLNGWHIFGIFGGGFGVIIAVNLFMAFQAVSTFPGLEVSSSYADSQTFDLRREAQEALGWEASVAAAEGEVILTLVDGAGRPVYPAELEALLTRPTTRTDDQLLALSRGPNGTLIAPAELAEGRWRLRMVGLSRGGTEYRHNITFTVTAP